MRGFFFFAIHFNDLTMTILVAHLHCIRFVVPVAKSLRTSFCRSELVTPTTLYTRL